MGSGQVEQNKEKIRPEHSLRCRSSRACRTFSGAGGMRGGVLGYIQNVFLTVEHNKAF